MQYEHAGGHMQYEHAGGPMQCNHYTVWCKYSNDVYYTDSIIYTIQYMRRMSS